jgi:hypothetical protein
MKIIGVILIFWAAMLGFILVTNTDDIENEEDI